jgi:hypothetical protein
MFSPFRERRVQEANLKQEMDVVRHIALEKEQPIAGFKSILTVSG